MITKIKELKNALNKFDDNDIIRCFDGYCHQKINDIDIQNDSETGELIVSLNLYV